MLNFEKANLKQRVQREEREHGKHNFVPRTGPLFSVKDSRWFYLTFGRWKGHSLPHVAIYDPQYLLWLAKAVKPDDGHRETLLWQANEIIHLATHILPPRRRTRTTTEFVLLQDGRHRLRQIAMCKVGKKLAPTKWSEASRCRYLDIHLITEFSNRERASERLGRFLRQTYFRDDPIEEKCEAFFDELSNFGRFKPLN